LPMAACSAGALGAFFAAIAPINEFERPEVELPGYLGVLFLFETSVFETRYQIKNLAAGREAQTPRLVGACERQARGFLGGALRCLACSEILFPKKIKKLRQGI
jgi:hypothetical protein